MEVARLLRVPWGMLFWCIAISFFHVLGLRALAKFFGSYNYYFTGNSLNLSNKGVSLLSAIPHPSDFRRTLLFPEQNNPLALEICRIPIPQMPGTPFLEVPISPKLWPGRVLRAKNAPWVGLAASGLARRGSLGDLGKKHVLVIWKLFLVGTGLGTEMPIWAF